MIRILLWVMILLPAVSIAQQRSGINGRVVNSKTGQGLEYATIATVDHRGKVAGTGIANSSGEFFIYLNRAGEYTVQITMVGYKSYARKFVYVQQVLDLGRFDLSEGLEIDGVEVSVKPLIRREADRIVFDVGSDPDAGRMKMMEIMKKIPLLERSQATGNLAYDNKSIGKILVDGGEGGLINGKRQYPMEFIRADYMDKVELILPNSPEYNNKEPMLVIQLDRPLPNGIAGEIRPAITTDRTYGSTLSLVTKNKLTGIGVDYGFRYGNPRSLENRSLREYFDGGDGAGVAETTDTRSQSHSLNRSHSVGLQLFRPLWNENTSLSVNANTAYSENVGSSETVSENFGRDGTLLSRNSTFSRSHSYSPMRFGGGIAFGKIKGKGVNRSDKFGIRYLYNDTRNNADVTSMQEIFPGGSGQRLSESSTGTRTHQARLNISRSSPVVPGKWSVDGDIGYVNRWYDNSSDYYVYDYATGEYLQETELHRGLSYRQQVANANIDFVHSLFKKKLRYNVGLNGEYVSNTGTFSDTGNTPLGYREFNLLPKMRLSVRLGKGFGLSGDYSTRVMRPSVNQLNPYVDDSDPQNLRQGNPELKGEYAHRFNGSIDFVEFKSRSIFELSYSAEFARNSIERVTTVDGNIATTTYENLGRTTSQGVSLYSSVRVVPQYLEVRLMASYSWSKYEFSSGKSNTSSGFGGMAMLTSSIKNVCFITLNYSLNPASVSAQRLDKNYYSTMKISLSRYFEKIRMGCSVDVSDVLHGRKFVDETIGSDRFIQYDRRQRTGRIFTFSAYWRFGRFKNQAKGGTIEGGAYDVARPGLFDNNK